MTRTEGLVATAAQAVDGVIATSLRGVQCPPFPWQTLAPRPTPDELAQQLLAQGEVQALRVAIWSQSDRAQLAEEVLKYLAPPLLASDLDLLNDAFALALDEMASGRRKRAGQFALAGIGGVLLLVLVQEWA